MALQIFLLALGFVLLIKGSDWLVGGASALARKFNISDLSIGLTIVAFGTSAPELVVNTFAAFQGHHDIVLGNVIGSNIFNIYVILGIAGIITPLVIQSSTVSKEIPFSFLAIIIMYILGNDFFTSSAGIISRLDGFILLILFCLFLYYVYKQLRVNVNVQDKEHINLSSLKIIILIISGLAGLIAGGRLIVVNAVQIAQAIGVSEKVIALTIVAAGTSLPELATSVVAALKKNNDIAVGNIIGSNIFNIFLILGASSVIKPVGYDKIFNIDLYFLSVGTIVLFIAMFTGNRKKLDRWEAVVFLLLYCGYLLYMLAH
ncbi:MAG: calcium/sodium antiporter [Prolixibacteraceae bacterium]|nr:calcium/sodium antiporter [Prolixibacteraceae bacterium]